MSVTDSEDYGSLLLNSNTYAIMSSSRSCELYGKKNNLAIEPLETASLSAPFMPLCGESIEYIARSSDGILAISNYRLYHQRTADGKTDYSIPLGLIEVFEIKDLFHIYISCKDVRTCRCSFPTNESCTDCHRHLGDSIAAAMKSTVDLFAFAYYASACEEGVDEVLTYLGGNRDNFVTRDIFKSELERMRFDVSGNCWRISSVNKTYNLCSSYPKYLIVPSVITDQTLEIAAKFRSHQRFPAVVWRHKENGMIIARCSQPEVGWLGWRSTEDEDLLKAIAETCSIEPSTGVTRPPKKLLVMDARSYTTAVANRARGGGCECPEYYPNCEIVFMSLANIHSIRRSFQSLRQLCASPADQINWHSMLEATRWVQHMSLLIQSAVKVVVALEKDVRPVLVHCSDGWDRTSQIVALAELLLDPYYRTVEGFQVLVEREWLEFGHKFADRCTREDTNEKCPIFLQWLDCVHNIVVQFPVAFEFSQRYLIKLAEHTYSNLFGTFLCNTNAERLDIGVPNKTFSVWKYLNSPHFRNYLYNPNSEKVLWPKVHIRDLEIWRDLYIDLSYDCQNSSDITSLSSNNNNNSGSEPVPEIITNIDRNINEHDEINNGNLHHSGSNLGSMLESAINCHPEDMSDSSSPKSISFDKVTADQFLSYPQREDDVLTESNNTIKFSDDAITTDGEDDLLEEEPLVTDDDGIRSNIYGEVIIDDIITNMENNNAIVENGDCIGSFFHDDVCSNDDDNNNSSTPPMAVPPTDATLIGNGVDGLDKQSDLDGYLLAGNVEFPVIVPTTITTTTTTTTATTGGCVDLYRMHGRRVSEVSSFSSGRTYNTGSLFLDPIDGLPLIPDDIQDRLQQISIEHKARMAALETELHTTRISLLKAVCKQCNHTAVNAVNDTNVSQTIPAERSTQLDDDKGSVCSTEVSWEAVEEKEAQPTLWMPDHAVSQCMNCDNKFWLGRRKHHCRSCGKIFCADCSNNLIPLPNEQLYEPVRVCESCYRMSSSIIYAMTSKQTCKQAAGEEPHNSNPVLPPTPPI